LAVSTTTRSTYAQPALIGGIVGGVLSALPFVAAGNLCCCLWIISGGAVAAYLFQQHQTTPITPGDGALVGLLAGLIGAFVQLLVSIPISILVGPMERAMLQRVIEIAGTMPPEMRDAIERYSNSEGQGGFALLIVKQVVTLMLYLFVGAIFSTIGGLLGALVFKKQTPPGVIDIPPTP
jgi:hypothetical protein